MNELLSKVVRLVKIYSLPFLTVAVAFVLYYAVFEIAHTLKKQSDSSLNDERLLVSEEEKTPEALPLIPLEPSIPEAPLPDEPTAPNLIEATPPALEEKAGDSSAGIPYLVETEVLNIREAPSTQAPVVAKKNRGERVEVSEIKNQWAKIPEGWAYEKLLRKVD